MPELSELQIKTIEAIVHVFETGKAHGNPGLVSVARGDLGGFSYGLSQASIASGNLYLLLKEYCEKGGAQFADQVADWLPRVQKKDAKLSDPVNPDSRQLKALLQEAGEDPLMMQTQEEFFRRNFYYPASRLADSVGLVTPLGCCVVYDSVIQGAFKIIRQRTDAVAKGTPEKEWVTEYVKQRRNWLANHSNRLLPKTVYRMDELNKLIAAQKWELLLPLTIRGCAITEAALQLQLQVPAPVRAAASSNRVLSLQRPFLRGDDVIRLQKALAKAGLPNSADGVFGPATEAMLRSFQRKNGLRPDGIATADTLDLLGIEE